MEVLVNIDTPDLEAAIRFYQDGLGFDFRRKLGPGVAELTAGTTRVYLLEKAEGSAGAGEALRRYRRHWTPVHLDVAVEDIEIALRRAIGAGAKSEAPVQVANWGKLALCADPFGHGFCLIEFTGRGYGELETD